MNVSYRWLRAIAPTITESPRAIADRLGMLGAPVDELIDLGAGLEAVVIARVTDVKPHPNADRLRVCTVDAGNGSVQVVCGAPNVEAGRYYPFAPVGALLPGGVEIRQAKLRGEISEGMLCSARELGLGRDHAGLMTLAGDWEPGASFLESLGLDDARLVLDLTPNRSDLLSHLGVARELAPGGVADLRLEPFGGERPEIEMVHGERDVATATFRVAIEDAGDCPRYLAAILEGIEVAPSPEWLATRLRSIGVRPINNVVDATNFVLHEVGQPLHAFDLHQVRGAQIRVRRARPGESIRTLDGVDRLLSEENLVIADGERPLALAGIMGGEESEVTAETSSILIECALFDPLRVRKTARLLGLSTDASHRFERGVDPDAAPRALSRVVDLILAVAGGSVAGPLLDACALVAAPGQLRVRRAAVRRLLGLDLAAEEIEGLLRPIGFEVESSGTDLEVRIPAFRPDVTREVDVIEEIARRRGYDSFEAELGFFRPGRVPEDALLALQEAMHELFARWGLLEARTAAFSPASPRRTPLLNPLSAEESHLRDDLTTGLLRRVEHNWSHGVRAIRLYEMGSVFTPDGSRRPAEEIRVAAVLTGPSRPPHWSGESAAWDVWELKGLIGELVGAVEGSVEIVDARDGEPYGAGERFDLRGATGQLLGTAGRIAAGSVDAPAWADPVWALEMVLEPRPSAAARPFSPLPPFPAVERDLALLVPRDLPAGRVEATLRSSGGDLLERVWPFDLYAGEGIPAGSRSVAWRLRFRHPERTLTDAEVDGIVRRQLRALEEEHGVGLR